MINAPIVSVIIPTYNRAFFLRDVSVPSVLRQSYKNLEVIIVDDGSTDDTKKIVNEIISKEKKIPIAYVYRENGGQGAARNTAIKRARGEWILPLDSDDALMPDGVKQLLEKALDSTADIVWGQTWRVRWDGRKIIGVGGATPSSVLLRKKIFDEFGYFDEAREFIGIEDVDHLYRLQPLLASGKIKLVSLSRPVAIYFSHHGQTTSLLHPDKLLAKADAMIKKWETSSTRDKQWKSNMAHWWRNKGVYEILLGERMSGLRSLRASLGLLFSLETLLLLFAAIGGRRTFVYGILPFRLIIDSFSFKIQMMADIARRPGAIEEIKKTLLSIPDTI